MLETRHLTKIYKPKKGVPVKALDDVSIRFPQKGMVFLLGKSGSGKSTLLNLLGGLDRYDSGEILIKDVSSKEFSQQHFDSYRNTYVGFIFQEYNVLEEFTVGANIALALELQGQRASDERLNEILTQVDLAGYGSRKPNELSGGQKQRVAIARALVKNPEIIMADEPTGALDSTTGRQVLDTLKKLSADKLVLVVSHDREFAERYADRIVELADGRVISDMEYDAQELSEAPDALAYDGDTVTVPAGYHLTEADRLAINAYLDARQNNLTLTTAGGGARRHASPTDQSKLTDAGGTPFRLIKSKLPLKSAFKIGASGLRHKKVRLVVTILLSCIAFGLFGLADTFGAYNHVKTCTNSLIDSGTNYASVQKNKKRGSGISTYYSNNGAKLTEDELTAIRQESNVSMTGIYAPFEWNLSFSGQYDTEAAFTKTDHHIYASYFTGLAEMTQARLDEMGYTLLAGRLPDGTKDELMLSRYACETFLIGGYSDGKSGSAFEKITAPEQLVGKTLTVGGRTFTITGIVDTHFDLTRYQGLTTEKENQTTADMLVEYALQSELNCAQSYSLLQVAMVGEGYVEALQKTQPRVKLISEGYLHLSSASGEVQTEVSASYIGSLADVNSGDIVWLDGEKTALGEKEIVISANSVMQYSDNGSVMSSKNAFDTDTDVADSLQSLGTLKAYKWLNDETAESRETAESDGYKIVGYLPEQSGILLCSDTLAAGLTDPENGVYDFAIGAMPTAHDAVQKLVAYCYREDVPVRYELMNNVTFELDTINDVLKVLAEVFLYIGLGFAAFAALMLANFIGTSISYKKQEIGILRAIGSRSNDVFRIFFSESFLIAMINFVLSLLGVGIATAVINNVIRTRLGVLITVLDFGVRQVGLLFAVSLLVAALASFFPVRRIAAKRPIDAIRNR